MAAVKVEGAVVNPLEKIKHDKGAMADLIESTQLYETCRRCDKMQGRETGPRSQHLT